MKRLRVLFVVTDFGFIVYWLLTLLHAIPADLAFRDYANPIVAAWNWSFLPLDLCISLTGIASLLLWRRNDLLWAGVALVSLALTFCSGLQAISFWTFAGDFDPGWWAFNLYLLVYPVFFMKPLLFELTGPAQPDAAGLLR